MQEKSVVTIEVPDEFDNQRLDIFITRMFDMIPSRSFATKLIENKKVKIDNKFFKSSYKLKKNQIAEIDFSFLNEINKEPVGERIPLNILYEDEDLIVINKEAGMVVHPGAGVQSGTLVNAILAYTGMTLPSLGGPVRAGIVHRLDRDTSGVMVVAKSQLALTHLSQQFAEHSQTRIYHAIVYGKLPKIEGNIETWHGRDLKNRLKYSVQEEGIGKKAILKYKLLKEFGNEEFSLVSCSLYTGRTHQIRVQMAYLGNGIVGDSLYSKIPDKLKNKKELFATVTKSSPRQMLHALHLGFVHPRHGNEMKFTAPYPVDFQNLYDLLQVKCN
ncbi:RluA family pseudouridine synthase [Pigmentibacter sp. JX0631]|uniref:RluA family pseudouridine synthase n=1 Tax=Pigmentibacter sp. JX0631 TaxID=2976982 RepID=UPI0024682BF7|nr:RluA family pseudouridine synthase [Pigmentibacter sp. JX0631]WGL61302.1 RluA family pseudouridine synthase [Pigmentibacter sp. JX0631]